MAAKEAVIVILCFVCCLYVGVHAQARDLTLEPDTSGSDVVRAAIAKVLTVSRNQTRIFGNQLNYWLLRRIAYVETEDGTDADTYSDVNYHGGKVKRGNSGHSLTSTSLLEHSAKSIQWRAC